MKKLFFLLIITSSNLVDAGEIKKVIDANGHVMYTNMNSGFRGKIVKRFNDGITYFRNERPSLANHVVKNGNNTYTFTPGSSYPTIFHHFSDSYRSRYSNGNHFENKSRYADIIADAASRHGVEERLVHAVIQAESAYNPSAVSRAGAVGLMQLMPATARRYGVANRTDPIQNVHGGTRYLKDLLDMFNYNLSLAVAAYNAGEGAVMRFNNSIPPYPETQNYVRQVLAYYHRSL